MSVSGASAIASDPRYISPRPYPTASGDPSRSNYQIFVAFKQEHQCKCSFQARQRDPYRVDWLESFLQLSVYQVSDHLGVCVRGKTHACQLELITQFAMI